MRLPALRFVDLDVFLRARFFPVFFDGFFLCGFFLAFAFLAASRFPFSAGVAQ